MRFNLLRSKIPIYLGAQKKHLLELTGEIADGGLPLLFPPEYIEDVLKHISTGATRAGRTLEDLDIVGCIWFSVSQNQTAAIDALRNLISF
jgi:5,10-methylenetetrahydromethanopterin reductase